MEVPPVRHRRALRCDAVTAFDTWVRDIALWWHPDYTPDPATFRDARVEPVPGGAVSFTCDATGTVVWGRVEQVERPRLLVHTSVLGQPSEHPTRIRVELVPSPQGTTLLFEHGGWHPSLAEVRQKFGEWPLILDRFVALADSRA